jgi:hypothetical protein
MVTPRAPVPAAVPLEGQARALLRSHPGDGLEVWLADQRWRPASDGSWLVEAAREGWTYRVEGLPGDAVRVIERAPGTASVISWLVV